VTLKSLSILTAQQGIQTPPQGSRSELASTIALD